jgi:hypothetical protein
VRINPLGRPANYGQTVLLDVNGLIAGERLNVD